MTEEDFRKVTDAFTKTASLAREAGYDGVQVHAAHGYLLSQFLCPYLNRRMDRYGGDIEGRALFPLEVCAAVRKAVGEDFPLLAKINSTDFMPDGLMPEDAVKACALLEQVGVDGIEMSGGMRLGTRGSYPAGKFPLGPTEGYYRDAARLYKQQVKTPLILVGGFRSVAGAGSAVKEGLADAVSFGRPFIREPDFPNKWKNGETDAATCVSCNLCATEGLKDGIRCVVP